MTPSAKIAQAQRAIGAIFYGAFGGAWVSFWAWHQDSRYLSLGASLAATLALLAVVWSRYRKCSSALTQVLPTPESARRDKWFHTINAGQWIVILIFGNVLANTGRGAWVIPMAMFVVGLHFLPLARLFTNPGHYFTGAALMACAAIYPFALAGPTAPRGALLAGLILWRSALWAIASK